MQYLPIYPEKSWSETVLSSGYRGNGREDGLPLTDSLITSMASLPNNYPETLYPRVIGGISMPFVMLADALGTMGNTAYNGYKRLYNYGANAYNNVADVYNNWQMQRNNPQTSLTGRKITNSINPANYNMTAAEVKKPTRYLANNGQPVAVIVEKNPTVIKPVPTQNNTAKRMIVNELSRMSNAGELQNNLTRTQKLIDLYNKIK